METMSIYSFMANFWAFGGILWLNLGFFGLIYGFFAKMAITQYENLPEDTKCQRHLLRRASGGLLGLLVGFGS